VGTLGWLLVQHGTLEAEAEAWSLEQHEDKEAEPGALEQQELVPWAAAE
jgi:hypothetical protein